MAFQAQDPEFARRVRGSFGRQGIMDHLGATLHAVTPGFCEIHVGFKPELSQQHGFFHGGVIGTIADSAAGYAGYSLMPKNSSVLTVEYKLNLISPAEGSVLVARGHVVKPGRTLVIARADVFVIRGEDEKLCATLLQTLMCMHDRPDTNPGAQTTE